MNFFGMREVKDLKELGAIYPTDKEIAEKVGTARAIRNIRKPIVAPSDGSAIQRRPLDPAVQKNLRELRNPQIVAHVRDKLELIEQELLYSNHDQAVERIIEALKYLENVRN